MIKMIEPGIYPNLSNEEYHGDKDSISRSKLLDLQISPFNYWAMHINPKRPKKEATAAMNFGTAFHSFILEPAEFQLTYLIEPEKVLLKDGGREAYETYKAQIDEIQNSGRSVISRTEWQTIHAMWRALEAHPSAMELIDDSIKEQSYFWQDKDSGLLVKSRPDILHSNMIVDLKTCASASPQAIQRAIVDGGYHMQMAMCRDAVRELEGRDIPNCILLCVEKTYPYAIGIYILDEEALEIGKKKYKSLCLDLVSCINSNSWPQYEPQTIGLPGWYR